MAKKEELERELQDYKDKLEDIHQIFRRDIKTSENYGYQKGRVEAYEEAFDKLLKANSISETITTKYSNNEPIVLDDEEYPELK